MPFKERVVTVKIHRDTHELLLKHKEQNGVSITFAIEKAVQEYFERLEQKED